MKRTVRAIWDGLYLPLGGWGRAMLDGRGIFFAHVEGARFAWREQGQHRWERFDTDRLPQLIRDALTAAIPESFLSDPPDDSVAVRRSLEEAVGALGWKGLAPLGLSAAPDRWRVQVWEWQADRIVAALKRYNVEVPVRSGDTVAFQASAQSSEVIPPTDQGFAEFLDRVERGRFQYGDLVEPTRAWWGREFPRGVADDRQIADLWDDSGRALRLRLEMAPQAGFSVADLGDRRWALAHVPSSKLLPMEFQNLDAAKLGARFLSALPSDGNEILLDAPKGALLRWLTEQSDLPSLSGLLERYRGL